MSEAVYIPPPNPSMNDWDRVSPAATLIQQARDFNEILMIWKLCQSSLYDVKLIYSTPDPAGLQAPMHALPRRLPKGGYFRSQYAYDYLFFLDDRVFSAHDRGQGTHVVITSSVLLDTNAASAIGVFFNEASKAAKKEAVDEALGLIIKEGVNFDYNFYALENAIDYYNGRNINHIRRRVREILKFDFIDRDVFINEGKRITTLNDSELDKAADEKLHALYEAPGRREFFAGFQGIYGQLYVLLLKMISLKFQENLINPDQKVLELVQFMHFKLFRLYVRELIVAVQYFNNPDQIIFFGKIKRPRPDILELAQNMAWDLTLFNAMGKFGTATLGADFLIEYFLSFDRKMVELFDICPIKGMISYGTAAQVISLAVEEPLGVLKRGLKDESVLKIVHRFFEGTANRLRSDFQERVQIADVSEIKEALEQEVVYLLN